MRVRRIAPAAILRIDQIDMRRSPREGSSLKQPSNHERGENKYGIRSHKDRLPIVSVVSQVAMAPTSNEVRLMSNQSMSSIFHSSHDSRASIFTRSGSFANSSYFIAASYRCVGMSRPYSTSEPHMKYCFAGICG